MKIKNITACAISALALSGGVAMAQQAGDWTLGVGIGHVHPKSNNGTLAGAATSIGSSTRPILTAEYFIQDNLGIELLAAVPFRHTITIAGVGTATTKHLPPTVSLNYHFTNDSAITPFLGAGINYTNFFSTRSALGNVRIKDSWGLALNAGVDFAVSERGAIRANLRWINIKPDVTLGGVNIGTAKIDPWVAAVSYVHRF
ncbi:OmpW/AlkL family protein [Roseinatronobacter alkalisoli]|uniref:Outer membrane beta-barrel protein n=1 Tax=Roseinatronobacter alkalisoli TaxID=3028235 RepID=A0ABT5T4S9_9RHOB|nr:OmpW family outer membrane protein [Roseinatronobacter sp. HJB301]MDD7970120.1 outer membrane beta-barrel protein [Roseinatronobacter sp. HJB301]